MMIDRLPTGPGHFVATSTGSNLFIATNPK